MAFLGSISDSLNQYGPIAWGVAGLLAILLIAVAFALFGYWSEKTAIADYARKNAIAISTNPLSQVHNTEQIMISDFFHPYHKIYENIRFENCDLIGPGIVFSESGSFDNCHWSDCQIVIIRTDRPITGAIHLKRPVILGCHLYRITFLMTIVQYQLMPAIMQGGLPVISDGRVGDV